MVTREARDKAAETLRQFLACETTNEEFDNEFAAISITWKRHTDRGIAAVYGFAWNLYDDFEEHTLEGAYELDPPVRAIAERCVQFLQSDCEYEWRRAKFIGLDWRRIFSKFLPWIKWEADPVKRFEQFMAEPAGDVTVWPFYCAEDCKE
jgi:hypothetical protein